MGIAAKLREPLDLRKSAMKIAQETVGHASVIGNGVAAQGQGKSLDVSCEDLVETGFGLAHGIGGVDNRARLAMARAYSRQTSWGASWT